MTRVNGINSVRLRLITCDDFLVDTSRIIVAIYGDEISLSIGHLNKSRESGGERVKSNSYGATAERSILRIDSLFCPLASPLSSLLHVSPDLK